MKKRLVRWSRSRHVASVALLCVIAVAALFTMGAGDRAGQLVGGAADQRLVLPAAQIISFGTSIGLLDTVTGAVYQLSGNLSNPGITQTWELKVPPVKGSTSGYLELQRATFNNPEALFLVDRITGRTWLFRWRSSGNGAWDPVEVRGR